MIIELETYVEIKRGMKTKIKIKMKLKMEMKINCEVIKEKSFFFV